MSAAIILLSRILYRVSLKDSDQKGPRFSTDSFCFSNPLKCRKLSEAREARALHRSIIHTTYVRQQEAVIEYLKGTPVW